MTEGEEFLEKLIAESKLPDECKASVRRTFYERERKDMDEIFRVSYAVLWLHPLDTVIGCPKGKLHWPHADPRHSTLKWIKVCSQLKELVTEDPDEPYWLLSLQHTEDVIEYRKTIPKRYQWWETDESWTERMAKIDRERAIRLCGKSDET